MPAAAKTKVTDWNFILIYGIPRNVKSERMGRSIATTEGLDPSREISWRDSFNGDHRKKDEKQQLMTMIVVVVAVDRGGSHNLQDNSSGLAVGKGATKVDLYKRRYT